MLIRPLLMFSAASSAFGGGGFLLVLKLHEGVFAIYSIIPLQVDLIMAFRCPLDTSKRTISPEFNIRSLDESLQLYKVSFTSHQSVLIRRPYR
ncbi:hypothetical protein CASFOL_025377 [Castilleja foliolosa]